VFLKKCINLKYIKKDYFQILNIFPKKNILTFQTFLKTQTIFKNSNQLLKLQTYFQKKIGILNIFLKPEQYLKC